MALNKVRSFEYRPPKRRAEAQRESESNRASVRIPISRGDEQRGVGMVVRLLMMLAAIVGLAMAMVALR
jgi:hypothetical protein